MKVTGLFIKRLFFYSIFLFTASNIAVNKSLFSLSNDNQKQSKEEKKVDQEAIDTCNKLRSIKIDRTNFLGIKNPSDAEDIQINIELISYLVASTMRNFESNLQSSANPIEKRIRDLIVHTILKLEEFHLNGTTFKLQIGNIQRLLTGIVNDIISRIEENKYEAFSRKKIENRKTKISRFSRGIYDCLVMASTILPNYEEESDNRNFSDENFGIGGFENEVENNQNVDTDDTEEGIESLSKSESSYNLQNLAKKAIDKIEQINNQPVSSSKEKPEDQNIETEEETESLNKSESSYNLKNLAKKAIDKIEQINNHPVSSSKEKSSVENIDSELNKNSEKENTVEKNSLEVLGEELEKEINEFKNVISEGSITDIKDATNEIKSILETILDTLAKDPKHYSNEMNSLNNYLDDIEDEFYSKLGCEENNEQYEKFKDFFNIINKTKDFLCELFNSSEKKSDSSKQEVSEEIKPKGNKSNLFQLIVSCENKIREFVEIKDNLFKNIKENNFDLSNKEIDSNIVDFIKISKLIFALTESEIKLCFRFLTVENIIGEEEYNDLLKQSKELQNLIIVQLIEVLNNTGDQVSKEEVVIELLDIENLFNKFNLDTKKIFNRLEVETLSDNVNRSFFKEVLSTVFSPKVFVPALMLTSTGIGFGTGIYNKLQSQKQEIQNLQNKVNKSAQDLKNLDELNQINIDLETQNNNLRKRNYELVEKNNFCLNENNNLKSEVNKLNEDFETKLNKGEYFSCNNIPKKSLSRKLCDHFRKSSQKYTKK